ncbi:MAG: serine/threonine-protein phosphatase [Alphaproteobacteria bacterium GM202ARS2]|nr:serine/threonine-protein phosphatase [Alphaproteobacteria bacterium GM202ARS2]
MSFRYQLLFLLLSVSVPPLVVVSVIDVVTLRDLAEVLAERLGLSVEQVRQESVFVRERVLFDVVVALVVLCVVVGVSWWWVGRFNARLEPLIVVVERAGRGDLRDEPRLGKGGRGRGNKDGLARLGVSLRRMVVSLREHQRLTASLSLARRVHESLLPAMPRRVCGYSIAARVDSCDFLGGDYYGVVESGAGGGLAVVVDICGHGASSALIAARTQGLLRGVDRASPSDVVAEVNRRVCADVPDMTFLSMMAVVLAPPPRPLCYCNAGHPPGVLYRAERDDVVWLGGEDLLVGVKDDWCYREHVVSALGEGDRLVLVTDGVYEAMNKNKVLYGKARLAALVRAHKGETCEALLDTIFRDVYAYQGGVKGDDDITAMVIAR